MYPLRLHGERHYSRTRRAAVLLEVVLAMSVFFLSATVVHSGLSSCLRAMVSMKRQVRGMNLAVTKLSEVQMGLVPMTTLPPTGFEEDPQLEGWQWELDVETWGDGAEAPLMNRLTVTITHEPSGMIYRLVELMPDSAPSGSPASAVATEEVP